MIYTTILVASTGLVSGLACGSAGVYFIYLHKKKHSTRSQYNTTFVFSGNLKQTGLLDAIQFLEMGRRDGILHIYCGRRKGYLTFVKGTVIDGFYRNDTGREAIFQMLDLEEGDFYFEPKIINQPKLINETMMDIAFEWDARKQGAAPK